MSEDSSNPRILVVDDVEETRMILDIIFREEGFEVFEAKDGPEALSKVEELTPEIVLLDINLPGMDGNEVLPKIKELDVFCYVVMITAYADITNVIQALKEGAKDFILKPFDYERLVATVNRLLEIRRQEVIQHEKQQMFESLMLGLPLGVLVIDNNGWVEWANDKLLTLIEADSLKELMGKLNVFNWNEMNKSGIQEVLEKALKGENIAHVNPAFPSLKGNTFPARIWAAPRLDASGKTLGGVLLVDSHMHKPT